MSDSAASPYFTSVPHPPAPTVPYPRQHPRPSSSPLRAEYTIAAIRRTPQNPPASARISTPSGRMVNYARQSSQNVVAAALMPSQERPKFEAKRFNSALPPIPSPNSTTVNKTPTSGKRSSASVDADKLDDYDITSSDAEIREVRKKSRRRRSPSIESSTKGDDEDHGKTSRRHRKLKSTAKKTSKPCKSSATRATPLNSRNKGLAVPKSFDDATESDRVMFKMRNEGKSWDEIRDRWIQMTGERPGRSTLSVRYCKLKANLSKTGGADVSNTTPVSSRPPCFFHLSQETHMCAGNPRRPPVISRRSSLLLPSLLTFAGGIGVPRTLLQHIPSTLLIVAHGS